MINVLNYEKRKNVIDFREKKRLFIEIFKIGARQGTLKEQIVWAYEYPIQWREPSLDQAELTDNERKK